MGEQAETTRVFAVLPAAGAGRRMGGGKLLLPWGETTVVEAAIVALLGKDARVVVAVVAPALADYCRRAGADVVVPEVAPPDMKASLQAGLRHLAAKHDPGQGDIFLVAPADMPWMRGEVIDAIIAHFAATDAEVVVPIHNTRRGHPVALSWRLAAEVLRLSEGETLKTIIERHRIASVECDDSVLGDLDTPEDYRAALERYGISTSKPEA